MKCPIQTLTQSFHVCKILSSVKDRKRRFKTQTRIQYMPDKLQHRSKRRARCPSCCLFVFIGPTNVDTATSMESTRRPWSWRHCEAKKRDVYRGSLKNVIFLEGIRATEPILDFSSNHILGTGFFESLFDNRLFYGRRNHHHAV